MTTIESFGIGSSVSANLRIPTRNRFADSPNWAEIVNCAKALGTISVHDLIL